MYREDLKLTEYKVIGPFEIDGKATGEVVDLDPSVVNIPALIDGGHVALSRPGFAQPAPLPAGEDSAGGVPSGAA